MSCGERCELSASSYQLSVISRSRRLTDLPCCRLRLPLTPPKDDAYDRSLHAVWRDLAARRTRDTIRTGERDKAAYGTQSGRTDPGNSLADDVRSRDRRAAATALHPMGSRSRSGRAGDQR